VKSNWRPEKKTKLPAPWIEPQKFIAMMPPSDEVGQTLYVAILLTTRSRNPMNCDASTKFSKAAEHAAHDPSVLKDVADYRAASQQLKEAIPPFSVLEL
jgi:hypothetical protein